MVRLNHWIDYAVLSTSLISTEKGHSSRPLLHKSYREKIVTHNNHVFELKLRRSELLGFPKGDNIMSTVHPNRGIGTGRHERLLLA